MNKVHFAVNGGTACGRTSRYVNDNVTRVTCLNCQNKDEFLNAHIKMKQAQEAEFQAQTPRTIVPQFGRVNSDGVMECFNCHGVLFRERPRSLFSYHYVCESCGKSMHPMTETGMCT